MDITIRCTHLERAACPSCGSKNVVGLHGENCHCGQCGQSIRIEIVEKVKEPDDTPETFTQMSLF